LGSSSRSLDVKTAKTAMDWIGCFPPPPKRTYFSPRESTGKSTRLNSTARKKARGKDVNDHHHQEPEATQLESVSEFVPEKGWKSHHCRWRFQPKILVLVEAH